MRRTVDPHVDLPQADALAQVLLLAEPLVQWCVQRGVGYGQLSKSLKPVFYEKALEELQRNGQKASDSALSMLSGLHKGDVLAFKLARQVLGEGQQQVLHQSMLSYGLQISPVQQVLARWLMDDVPSVLPFKSSANSSPGRPLDSFSALVQSANRTTSQGFSAALVLQEMQRQGLVEVTGNQRICLLRERALSSSAQEADRHFTGAGRDLLRAILANLDAADAPPFLEQSLDVDGLSPDSASQLQSHFRQWWQRALQALTPLAIQLNEKDLQQAAPSGHAPQRLRLGVYVYAEDVAQASQQVIDTSESGA